MTYICNGRPIRSIGATEYLKDLLWDSLEEFSSFDRMSVDGGDLIRAVFKELHAGGEWGRRYFVLTHNGQLKWYSGPDDVYSRGAAHWDVEWDAQPFRISAVPPRTIEARAIAGSEAVTSAALVRSRRAASASSRTC